MIIHPPNQKNISKKLPHKYFVWQPNANHFNCVCPNKH
ncbi:hypothetical protein M23134_01114 [Microscilla marina ATCC 23134]|uniref:Uncharacterized protein n=1 Tax=Microscilla marina ATCC 23134 TaxID=313606 RepID=A1ZFL6_MICM2|nr:hypothetical protein M23134_01114 [Microscilla marina ATCC 23134]